MYFPLLKPHGQRKRSAAQPKTIDSEFPENPAMGLEQSMSQRERKCFGGWNF